MTKTNSLETTIRSRPSQIASIIAAGLNTGLLRNAAAALILMTTAQMPISRAFAEQTTSEKVDEKADSAKKDTKKKWRKTKKEVRDATGNGDKTQDVKDSMKNAKDSVQHEGDKIKDKVD